MSETLQTALAGFLGALTVLLLGATPFVLAWLGKKWGAETVVATLSAQGTIGDRATSEAEQWRKTERDRGREPEPQELLDRARDRVIDESAARGIALAPGPATALVEAKVAEARRSVHPPALPDHDDLTDGAADA